MKESMILGLSLALILASCSGEKEEKEPSKTTFSAEQLSIAIGTGRVEPSDKVVMLSSELAGTVKGINFKPGDSVMAGAAIIQLHNETELAQLNQIEAQLRSQFRAIEVAKAQLSLTQNDAQFLKNELDRNARLKAQGSVSEQTFRDAENAWKQAIAKQESAQQTWLQSQSKLEEIQAQLAYQRALCEKKKIEAPSNGRILSIEARKGQYLTPGFAAVEFAPEGPLSVWTEIDELLADQLKLGQVAVIRPQGSTDTLSLAEVVYIAPALRKKSLFSDQSDNLEDRRVREVQVKLLNPRSGLLTGSRVECVIKLR